MKHALLAAAVVTFALTLAASTPKDEQPPLAKELEPLRPLLGKNWRGEFKNSSAQKPIIDVARWERALNGQAVRVLHSINDGAYGGESIIRWNANTAKIEYYYFTTAGFMTRGTVTAEPGKLLTHENVEGSSGGITEVRGTYEVLPDGRFRATTEHLKDGKWEPGRETLYTEAADAKVVFN